MMASRTVTTNQLRRYGEILGSIATEASDDFGSTVRERAAELAEEYGDVPGWPNEIAHGFRDYAAETMVEKWEAYSDASSSVGSMMYEETVGDSDGSEVMMTDTVVASRAEASAQYWAESLFGDDADIDRFIDGCASFVERNVRHAADVQTMEEAVAGAKAGKRVRFARVPQGPSCGFCIMLASRGFVYATEESAGAFNQWHDRCDCEVIAGYPGLKVEGYDYKGMYARYRQCLATIGGIDQLQKDWDALSQKEKDGYGKGPRALPMAEDPENDAELRKRYGNNADAVNDYMMQRIVREMNTRDREWLYSGTCEQTRLRNHPVVARIREQYPEAYDEWQAAVSRLSSYKTSQSQRKHVLWTEQYGVASEPPSFFTVDWDREKKLDTKKGKSDTVRAVRELIDEYAGRGYPDITVGGLWVSHAEIVVCDDTIGCNRRTATETRAIKLHYGTADGNIHAVPRFDKGGESDGSGRHEAD